MESKNTGNIILMQKKCVGFVVFSGSAAHPIGYSSGSWEMDHFIPYYGTVVLNTGGKS